MTKAGRYAALGEVLCLCACGDDDGMRAPLPDSGTDATIAAHDAGRAPECGASICGSPLVGDHCCTRRGDVSAGVAVAVDRCGVDLGSTVPNLGGDCVELRQSGDLDSHCPARAIGTLSEPGCCMPDGVCGTLNRSVDLGCQRVLGGAQPPVACGGLNLDAGNHADAD